MTAPRNPTHTAPLPAFDYQSRTRLPFGVDRVNEIGALAREMGARKVLLVTDRGIVAAGHAERVRARLEAAGLTVTVFDKARENPTTACVDACLVVARSAEPDTIIGLGGGSAM